MKAFTLVELIVVIVILAIIATIAFLSFSSQSRSARDSSRLTDIASIRKGFEMFNINSGTYPAPDRNTPVIYSGGAAWNQGVLGETAYRLISKTLSKNVKDPLSDAEYGYSLTSSRKEYQLSANLENPTSLEQRYDPFESTDKGFASDGSGSNMYISGNYNGLLTKVFTGTTCLYVPTPTLFGIKPINEQTITFDSSFGSGTIMLPGVNNFAKFNANEPYICNSAQGDSESVAIVQWLQKVYTGSNVSSTQVQEILSADPDRLSSIGTSILNKFIGGSCPPDNSTLKCTFSGTTINPGETMTLYSASYIAGTETYDCTSKQQIMSCNNGVLSGDTSIFKNSNCVKGTINNCAADPDYAFNGHIYSINALDHSLKSTNIYSSGVAINNGIFRFKLDSIECNDGILINATENPTPIPQSCNSGYIISGNDCVAVINGACGSSNGGTAASAPTSNLCSAGTSSTVSATGTGWIWTCSSTNGGTTSNCSVAKNPIDGVCGTSNGGSSVSEPSTGLCATGTSSSLTYNGSGWTWSCAGQYGGNPGACSATQIPMISTSYFLLDNTYANHGSNNKILNTGTAPLQIGISQNRLNTSLIGKKAYAEFKVLSSAGSYMIGIATTNFSKTRYPGGDAYSIGYYVTGQKYFSSSSTGYGNSYTTNDVIGVAYDSTTGNVWFSKNGVWQASGNPSTGANPAFTSKFTGVDCWFSVGVGASVVGSYEFMGTPTNSIPSGFTYITD